MFCGRLQLRALTPSQQWSSCLCCCLVVVAAVASPQTLCTPTLLIISFAFLSSNKLDFFDERCDRLITHLAFLKKQEMKSSFHNPLKRAVKHGSRICRLSVSSESSRGRRGRLFASALVFSASKTKKPPVGWKKKEKEKVTMQDHNTHLNKFCFLQPHNNKKTPRVTNRAEYLHSPRLLSPN